MPILTAVLLFYYNAILGGDTSTTTIKDYIVTEALVMGVNPQIALGVVDRESKFNVNAVGDHGESFGAWQIHVPAHKEVSAKQAKDIIFATRWSLIEIKENGCTIWSTCADTMKSLTVDT